MELDDMSLSDLNQLVCYMGKSKILYDDNAEPDNSPSRYLTKKEYGENLGKINTAINRKIASINGINKFAVVI